MSKQNDTNSKMRFQYAKPSSDIYNSNYKEYDNINRCDGDDNNKRIIEK